MLVDYKKVNVYQEEKLILADVDFQANAGEFIYIIGKVGSGKSSLLKTMYDELDIFKGEAEEATVLGRDMMRLKNKDVAALRREMGIIFQDFQLLHDRTVEKNLHFVLKATGWNDKNERSERIDEVLDIVGLKSKKGNLPHELSGGEQQRIAIARALLNNPKLIIADEPTGNLDPDTAAQIVSTLKDITKNGTCVIMSTHNWAMMEQFPGIIYKCEDGKLIEDPFGKNAQDNKPVATDAAKVEAENDEVVISAESSKEE